MKHNILSFLFTIVSILIPQYALSCTSAIIGAKASASGRPMLWKHRDTSTIDNKVEYIPSRDGCFGYVALFNADDRLFEQAWTGMNEMGFAIMNTASYNIKDDNVPAKEMDKEGFLMTEALKHCTTLDDFSRLLDSYPRPMGVEANFGVIDAFGNAAYFETNNHSYKRYDVADSPDNILVRTNYSHGGRPDEGYGFIREKNALKLIDDEIDNGITPMYLTETMSRSFYHSLYDKDFSESEKWVVDQDFIPRYKSTATIVIEGCIPVSSINEITPDFITNQYIMWTGLGYPPCSEIVPVYCREDGVANDLRGLKSNGHSEMSDKVKARRDDVFPLKKGSGDKYIDMEKLFNENETGYVQILRKQNEEVYRMASKRRSDK